MSVSTPERELDAILSAAFSDHPFGDEAVERIVAGLPHRQVAKAPKASKSAPAEPRRGGRVLSGFFVSAAAAALLCGVALSLIESELPAPSAPGPVLAQSIGQAGEGLLRLDEGNQTQLSAGAPIRVGERLLAVAHPATIELSDGTHLDLHADTELSFRRESSGGLTVLLHGAEGRLFCEVAKQHAPFRVEGRDLAVQVLGTRFLVEQSTRSSKVVVVEGRVRTEVDAESVVLGAGDQAEAFLDESVIEQTRVTPRRAALWVPRLRDEQRAIDRSHTRRTEPSAPVVTPPPAPAPEVGPPELDQPVVPPVGPKAREEEGR